MNNNPEAQVESLLFLAFEPRALGPRFKLPLARAGDDNVVYLVLSFRATMPLQHNPQPTFSGTFDATCLADI